MKGSALIGGLIVTAGFHGRPYAEALIQLAQEENDDEALKQFRRAYEKTAMSCDCDFRRQIISHEKFSLEPSDDKK